MRSAARPLLSLARMKSSAQLCAALEAPLPPASSGSVGPEALHALRDLEQLKLLLFLHARPCRTYGASFLEGKLGITRIACLDPLVRSGLVVASGGSAASYGYGVEDPALLALVDALARDYQAISALLGFVARVVRKRASTTPARTGPNAAVAKPRQGVKRLMAQPAHPARRTRRGPRLSIVAALGE